MSLLADIYISRESGAVNYDAAPDQFTERVQYKGITPLELSILGSILSGTKWDVAMMSAFPCLLVIDGGERLTHQIPPAMILELAALTPDRIASVTSAWAASEELSCDPEDIRPTVDDLVRLACRAQETNRNLYLWNCV